MHLFVPYFDAAAVEAVVEDRRNVEDVLPSETGSSRALVTLTRRLGLSEVFDAIAGLVTYRVNAARAQSHLRRYMGLARGNRSPPLSPEGSGAGGEGLRLQ